MNDSFKYYLLGGMFLSIIVFASLMYSQTYIGEDIELEMVDYNRQMKLHADSIFPNYAENEIDINYSSQYSHLVDNVWTEFLLEKCTEKDQENLISYFFNRLHVNYISTSNLILNQPDSILLPKLKKLIAANEFLLNYKDLFEVNVDKCKKNIEEAKWVLEADSIKNELDNLNEFPGVSQTQLFFNIIDSLCRDSLLVKKHNDFKTLVSYKDTMYKWHINELLCYEDKLGDVQDGLQIKAQVELDNFKKMSSFYATLYDPFWKITDEQERNVSDNVVESFTASDYCKRFENSLSQITTGFESYSPYDDMLPMLYGNICLLKDSVESVKVWCYLKGKNLHDRGSSLKYFVGNDSYCTFYFHDNHILYKITKSNTYRSSIEAEKDFNKIVHDLEMRYANNKRNRFTLEKRNILKVDNGEFALLLSLREDIVDYSIVAY